MTSTTGVNVTIGCIAVEIGESSLSGSSVPDCASSPNAPVPEPASLLMGATATDPTCSESDVTSKYTAQAWFLEK